MKSRLIVADDHEVVRQGLREIVARAPNLEIVAEAADGMEALRLARTVPADLMILDIALPRLGGAQVLETLRGDGVGIPVLLFSMHPAAQYLDFARRKGAQGFVSKSDGSEQLLRAIRLVLAGRTCFPRVARARPGPPPARPDDPFCGLSRRESDVLNGLLRGEPLVEISRRLGINAKTVSTYRRRLLDKLAVGSDIELAALATRHGYV